jgi:hypothetical protein
MMYSEYYYPVEEIDEKYRPVTLGHRFHLRKFTVYVKMAWRMIL